MSELYGEAHRELQDAHGTRALADRLESMARTDFDDKSRAFIEQASMFFLATVDALGRPTVSYKGGAPGFVRILGPQELVFPSYDGNGMFLSLGNISRAAHVGLLFVDFDSGRRLRVQGSATVLAPDLKLDRFAGAQHLVRVQLAQLFGNCGRYVHMLKQGTLSPHLPDAAGRQPFPAWKRIDLFAGSLPAADLAKVTAAGGTISTDAYCGEDLRQGVGCDPEPHE